MFEHILINKFFKGNIRLPSQDACLAMILLHFMIKVIIML